ncbi:hypothetical protein [Shewanella sp. MEBiC00475]|uniref:hypothetical protein n=1 Tax=Shewanella sp. MEBiC00475 TaxID=2575361 RepID=UPI0020C7D8BE|nr:hypothetical protein [Shewanella sp. MEBiC00475]
MDNKNRITPIYILMVIALVYLPFIDSWLSGIFSSLNWQSPILMDQLSDHFRVIKLIFVCLGGLLLYKKSGKIRQKIGSVLSSNCFIYSGYLLILLQVPFLYLGIWLEGASSSDLNYMHKEKTFDDRTIYVYTADPGAMGKAYHYFYLKCRLPFDRYELKIITKMDWMYEYSFEVKDNELVVINKNEQGKIKGINLSDINCDL